jgi:hypothetical protein
MCLTSASQPPARAFACRPRMRPRCSLRRMDPAGQALPDVPLRSAPPLEESRLRPAGDISIDDAMAWGADRMGSHAMVARVAAGACRVLGIPVPDSVANVLAGILPPPPAPPNTADGAAAAAAANGGAGAPSASSSSAAALADASSPSAASASSRRRGSAASRAAAADASGAAALAPAAPAPAPAPVTAAAASPAKRRGGSGGAASGGAGAGAGAALAVGPVRDPQRLAALTIRGEHHVMKVRWLAVACRAGAGCVSRTFLARLVRLLIFSYAAARSLFRFVSLFPRRWYRGESTASRCTRPRSE